MWKNFLQCGAVLLLLVVTQVTSAAEFVDKAPPPPAADLQASQKLIDEIYGGTLARARDNAARAEVARRMLQSAIDTVNDLPGRFALFSRTIEVAREAEDIDTAFSAVDGMLKSWTVDGLNLRLEILSEVRKTARGRPEQANIARVASRLVDESLSAERYVFARRFSDIAVNSSRRSGDVPLIKAATVGNGEVGEIQLASASITASLATLKAHPDNEEANLAVGKFECFMRGDWASGLPRLALGSDPQLKEIAMRDLARPTLPDAQIILADAWWERAANETGLARKQILAHSAAYYRMASSTVGGLVKAKSDKRAADAATEAPVIAITPRQLMRRNSRNGIEFSNSTDAREGLELIRGVYTRYPDVLKDAQQVELVKFHDAAEFHRHSGDARQIAGSYSASPVAGTNDAIMFWGIYEEWKPGNYLVVYRLQPLGEVTGENIVFLDVCTNGNTIAGEHRSPVNFLEAAGAMCPFHSR